MIRQIQTWDFITSSLEKNIPVMLLYVLESSGSSPGRQGFFMAVNADSDMQGSIGGGMMEHKLVELAKQKLRAAEINPSIKRQIHDQSAMKDRSGMICSGEQTVLILQLTIVDLKTIKKISSSLKENVNGELILSPEGLKFEIRTVSENYSFLKKSETDWTYKEKTGFKNKLIIIGGGHCSLALSQLMLSMDFFIVVYDDRNELKTMVENNAAHEKHFIKNYNELAELIESDKTCYVVIMTMGYRTDDIALRAILGKEFAYLGLLGSKNKIEKMFEQYRNEGIELKSIHAPIGISIHSQTPEEIAVSIAGEIIQIKNGGISN